MYADEGTTETIKLHHYCSYFKESNNVEHRGLQTNILGQLLNKDNLKSTSKLTKTGAQRTNRRISDRLHQKLKYFGWDYLSQRNNKLGKEGRKTRAHTKARF